MVTNEIAGWEAMLWLFTVWKLKMLSETLKRPREGVKNIQALK